jgi:hypothetical protein
MADRREITLLRVELVEIDIVLDGYTGNVLTVVDIVGRDNGESSALRLPSELRNVVYNQQCLPVNSPLCSMTSTG